MVNTILRPNLDAHPTLRATVVLGLTLIWCSPTPRLGNVNGEGAEDQTYKVELDKHSVFECPSCSLSWPDHVHQSRIYLQIYSTM